jgi:methanogenic corrinoid protein MtbC1
MKIVWQQEKYKFILRIVTPDARMMIGGAPVTDKYAQEIGANYSYDAATAVDLAKQLMSA